MSLGLDVLYTSHQSVIYIYASVNRIIIDLNNNFPLYLAPIIILKACRLSETISIWHWMEIYSNQVYIYIYIYIYTRLYTSVNCVILDLNTSSLLSTFGAKHYAKCLPIVIDKIHMILDGIFLKIWCIIHEIAFELIVWCISLSNLDSQLSCGGLQIWIIHQIHIAHVKWSSWLLLEENTLHIFLSLWGNEPTNNKGTCGLVADVPNILEHSLKRDMCVADHVRTFSSKSIRTCVIDNLVPT